MHQHDIKPEEGVPYCEFLAAAKRSLEDRLATLERHEQSRRKLLEYLERFETVDEEEAGVIVPAWPMTEADVKRAVLRQWQHSDGTPLTAEEEAERERHLFEALRNLKYSRAMHDAVVGLRADVERARYSLAEWRTAYNQGARIQAKHESDTSGARNANRSARRTRGRRGKR